MTVSGSTARPCSTVDEAMTALTRLVAEQRGGDQGYFESQGHRFRHAVARLQRLHPTPCRVLDIGSHYLHQAALLRLLGHDVVGVDVPVFATADFVVERSRRLGIENVVITSMEEGDFLQGGGHEGTFDIVVFTAVLEHITFNPVRFWRRIYELLSDKGLIYLTTPNSLRPAAILNHLLRLVTFKGLGLPVEDVLNTVTYGHHWKEYSSREIKEYFRLISPDFTVSTNWYNDAPASQSLLGTLARTAGVLPFFRPAIEGVASLSGKTGTLASVPELPMAAARRQSPTL
jgi:SAM-dependent methyltransferase